MAQLDGSGGGSGSVGEDNLDGSDTQQPVEDDADRTPQRRMRDDATSDPMADQTEPAPSPEGTTAQVDAGDGGSGATSQPTGDDTGGQQTGPGPADGPRTASGSGAAQTAAETASDAGADEVPTGGRDDPRISTGTPGGGSARRPPPSQRDQPGGQARDSVPEDDVSPETVEVAEEQVSQQLGQNVEYGEDFVLVRTDDGYRTRLTGSFAGELSRERAQEAGLDLGERAERAEARGELAGGGPALESGGTVISIDAFQVSPGDARSGRTAIDVESVEESAEAQDRAASEIEEDIEAAVGAERARRAGITDPQLRQNVIENTDLRRGEDFTVSFTPTSEGGVRVSAGLTESFRRAEAERVAERRVFNQAGVRLEAGEDFELVETDSDGFAVQLTEEGAEQIREEEPEEFGDIDWSFGRGDPEVDEVERTLEGASASIQEAGETFASALFDEGGIASESAIAWNLRTSPTDFTDEELTEEQVRAAGVDPATVFRESDEQLATTVEEGGRAFGKGVAQTPFLLGDLPGLAKTGLEGIEYGVYATGQPLPETGQQTYERGGEIVEALEEQARENPAGFAGMGVGALAGSYGVMRAASRVSPRAGLASRLAIQPGEEIAGYGGHFATRTVASGRLADRLFPNKEPLIFSEEAALRTSRWAYSRARGGAVAARARTTDIVLGEPETSIRRRPSSFEGMENTELVTERPGVRAQASAGARGLREAFSGRTYAGVPIPRTEFETRSEASTSAETEALVDDLEGPLRRMERAREQQARARADRARSRFDVETNPFRSRARGRGAGLETEAAEDEAVRRLETAQEPSTQVSPLELSDVDVRSRLAEEVAGTEVERGRADTLLEVEQELEQELEFEFEMEFEQELELDLEQEFENELELETDFEFEDEIEAERFGPEPRERDREDAEARFGGWTRLVERDLLNPFTGE